MSLILRKTDRVADSEEQRDQETFVSSILGRMNSRRKGSCRNFGVTDFDNREENLLNNSGSQFSNSREVDIDGVTPLRNQSEETAMSSALSCMSCHVNNAYKTCSAGKSICRRKHFQFRLNSTRVYVERLRSIEIQLQSRMIRCLSIVLLYCLSESYHCLQISILLPMSSSLMLREEDSDSSGFLSLISREASSSQVVSGKRLHLYPVSGKEITVSK